TDSLPSGRSSRQRFALVPQNEIRSLACAVVEHLVSVESLELAAARLVNRGVPGEQEGRGCLGRCRGTSSRLCAGLCCLRRRRCRHPLRWHPSGRAYRCWSADFTPFPVCSTTDDQDRKSKDACSSK